MPHILSHGKLPSPNLYMEVFLGVMTETRKVKKEYCWDRNVVSNNRSIGTCKDTSDMMGKMREKGLQFVK